MKHLIPTGVIKIIFLTGSILLCPSLSGQKDPLRKAGDAFNQDKYREALVYYNRIEGIERSGPIRFKRGVCLYETNQLDAALQDFQQAYQYGFKDPLIDLYTGMIHHNKGAFEIAATHYKRYLAETPLESADRIRIRRLIKQCGRAVDLSYYSPIAIIERGPKQINTVYDELGMIPSPTVEGKYYYTSNRPNTSLTMDASDFDIYQITVENNKWSEPTRLPYAVNKGDEEVLLGFTQQADGIIFYRGTDFAGDITLHTNTGKYPKSLAMVLPASFNLQSSDAYFFDDQLVIFSARLDDTYGGYDLYFSKFENEEWQPPVNLGGTINSAHDEVSPFLSADGSELYFSSNRDVSIGGHDIFFSSYLYEAERWGEPQNLGIPINSPGDDVAFELGYDGLSATLSSNRKTATGGMDIFIARFKNPRGQQDYTSGYLPFADYTISVQELEIVAIDSTVNEDFLLADENEEIKEPKDSDTALIETELVKEDTHKQITYLSYEPLYYNDPQDVFNEENTEQINLIAAYLMSNPTVLVNVAGHTTDDGITEYKLYSAIKLAERVANRLHENGVPKRQLHVKSYADNYPLAKTESMGGEIGAADKYNARIEFEFYTTADIELPVDRISPILEQYSYDSRYDILQALMDNSVTFKIQIAYMSQMYRGVALELFNDASVEKDKSTGLYIYTVGLYDNYAEALNTKRDLERMGLTGAEILPYFDGRKLTDDRLSYLVNDFPDLKNLMNYGN